MQIVWINKNKNKRIILFFNGWGMDATVVSHLETDSDVIMFYDYRTLECKDIPSFKEYDEIYVVAWSMGVWAAANILSALTIKTTACIALNGTERPVDDDFGIPNTVYQLTEKGMDERGREKFFFRMLADKSERERFVGQKPDRNLSEQLEELIAIRKQSCVFNARQCWTTVYISQKDVIFPVENQQKWWKDVTNINYLPGGHYPFYCFKSWEEIF